MSVEEEVELRDLVSQTLELNGCLPKIRAQLRANLFLALDEDAKISKQQPLLNNKIKSCLEEPEGQIMFCVVREFLEYFNLDFTISVYEPESYAGNHYKYEGRQKIIEDLGLKNKGENCAGPVLLELVKIAQMKSKTLKINLTNINGDRAHEQKDSTSVSSVEEVNGHSNLSERKENSLNDKHESHFNKTYSYKKGIPSMQVQKSVKDNYDNVEIRPTSLQPPLNSTFVKKETDDDTFNGTSSIEEESVNGTDSSADANLKALVPEENSSTSQDTSPESKSKSEDRVKSPSQLSDKLKSKLDLSPLQLNKSRGSDILPSLYNKDFKEKNNKELDTDFDFKDDYEEDFMSGSEVEFSLSHVSCPKPLLEELQQYEHSTSFENISNTPKNKISATVNKHKNGKNSSSDISNNTATSNIETNLSIRNEVVNNSSYG